MQQGQVRQELKRIHYVLKLRGNLWTGENTVLLEMWWVEKALLEELMGGQKNDEYLQTVETWLKLRLLEENRNMFCVWVVIWYIFGKGKMIQWLGKD